MLKKQWWRTIQKAYSTNDEMGKMANKQPELEDEITVVCILSVVFTTLMILIINAYSNIAEPETTLVEQTRITHAQSFKQTRQTMQPAIIKTSIRTEM